MIVGFVILPATALLCLALIVYTLVLHGKRAAVQTAQETQDARETETCDFSGRRILVAEDVDINREIVGALLESTNALLEYAEDGKKALELFTAAPDNYDLILMDVEMPVMDGLEASRKIREFEAARKRKSVPIIAMTGDTREEDVKKCLKAGMNSHLGKPLDFDLTVSALAHAFGKRVAS
jgi:CheY-like chemotaxis protein